MATKDCATNRQQSRAKGARVLDHDVSRNVCFDLLQYKLKGIYSTNTHRGIFNLVVNHIIDLVFVCSIDYNILLKYYMLDAEELYYRQIIYCIVFVLFLHTFSDFISPNTQ